MNIIVCMLLIIFGVITIIKPKAMWIIGDSWKLKAKAEPTEIYLIIIRIVGSILVIAGIFAAFEM
ncbi:DUF6199 family natural product biosynthesis protein [Clostridium sp. UBA6640]|uniref:DUF6199 family natural product biosynthesis protein n=1 Tax=Clostridium sp. UBA6640 TaxID=1946370 RepID=UPI0025BB3DFA|nr:DUF6199 family natural product biosynthesis protein [Clostridium sp. UBA6640]